MHDHHHDHGHHHHHPTTDKGSDSRIARAFFINLAFTLIEFVGGVLTNSTAILADAVHDLGDSLSLGFGWLLSKLSRKKPDAEYSYGYTRFSLLGALINGAVLVGGSIWILSEAIPRLANPVMPVAEGMIGLAILGIVVNGWAAWSLSSGTTMNEKVLNWHLLEDVLGWVAVLIVSIVLMFVDLPILDPLLSIAFTCFILFNVVKYLYQTIRIFLQAVPDKALHQQIHHQLLGLPDIENVHHLHLWSLDGSSHVMTVHLALNRSLTAEEQTAVKQDIANRLKSFNLQHTTIELEMPAEVCRDFENHSG